MFNSKFATKKNAFPMKAVVPIVFTIYATMEFSHFNFE